MIKEFWKERKEEKARQKAEKKKNKKKYHTREEKAYKVFGVLFTIFMIIMCIVVSVKSCAGIGDYDWNSIIGITDEMIEALETPVYESQVVSDKLDVLDWSECRDKLLAAGFEFVVDNAIDKNLFDNNSKVLESSLLLKGNEVGALVKAINTSKESNTAENLLQCEMYQDGEDYYMTTVMIVDLKGVVLSNNLPKVYVKTTSTLRILNNQVASLNPDFQINVIDSTLNDKIVETLEDSSLLGLHKFTNDSVVSVINGFINRIYSGVVLTANGLEFVVKSI